MVVHLFTCSKDGGWAWSLEERETGSVMRPTGPLEFLSAGMNFEGHAVAGILSHLVNHARAHQRG